MDGYDQLSSHFCSLALPPILLFSIPFSKPHFIWVAIRNLGKKERKKSCPALPCHLSTWAPDPNLTPTDIKARDLSCLVSLAVETCRWVPKGPSILRDLLRCRGERILFLATSLRIRLRSKLSRVKVFIYGPVLYPDSCTCVHTQPRSIWGFGLFGLI